jgi:magnesium-protoporphyrin O-methyltransferase
VVAIDLSATLVGLASERVRDTGPGTIDFRVGDMLDGSLGRFDYCVAMDSFIHYDLPDMIAMVQGLAERSRRGVVFTFAPRTRPLAVMHAVGRLFPRTSRAPSVEPLDEGRLRRGLEAEPGLAGWQAGRTHRVARGFYISQAMEVRPR